MTDTNVNLNVHEIGVILSALQLIDISNENLIARDYGSVPALYNKLYSVWENMDRTKVGLRYDLTPSF
jgi:hypothetical protein